MSYMTAEDEQIWLAFFREECKKLPLNVSHIFSGSIVPTRETQAKIQEQMTFVHKAQIIFAAKNADMMLAEFRERSPHVVPRKKTEKP